MIGEDCYNVDLPDDYNYDIDEDHPLIYATDTFEINLYPGWDGTHLVLDEYKDPRDTPYFKIGSSNKRDNLHNIRERAADVVEWVL